MAASMMSRAEIGRFLPALAFVYNRSAFHQNLTERRIQWSRSYGSRGLRRTPVKVILPDGEELDAGGRPLRKNNKIEKQPVWREDSKRQTTTDYSDVSSDQDGIPHYIKLGANSKLFSAAIQLTRNRKAREKQGKILLEGVRLIQDALDAGLQVHNIFFSQEETLRKLRLPGSQVDAKLYKVMYKHMTTWSNLITCPGIMGVFQQPNFDTLNIPSKRRLPISVLCDNVRDPGNLGSILRCAAAAGCVKVVLTKGCVDPWDPKVLRSAAGAHFHVRLECNVQWDLMANYFPEGARVCLAEAGFTGEDSNFHFEEQDSDVDSFPPGMGEAFATKEPKWYEVTVDGKIRDPTYSNEEKLGTYRGQPLNKLWYDEDDYCAHDHVVLVVGGETEGLSGAAYKLAQDWNGICVGIPLGNGIESLNSSVATGIILFEIQRQMRSRKQGVKINLDAN